MFQPTLAILGVILLHISLIYGDDACGITTFNSTTGQPAGTDPGKGKNCTYYIVANDNAPQVSITFKAVNLDAAVFNLTVYGGSSTTGPVIANLTQVSQGLQDIMVISGYNVTTIVFSHANTTDAPVGPVPTPTFSASYDTKACSFSEQSLGGVIRSPIYKPNNGSVKCLYTESIPLQTMVVVSFLNFNVLNGSVDVMLGKIKTNVTGTTLPDDIFGSMSATTKLMFNITFNNCVDPQNFSASFQTIDQRCSGVFNANDDFQLLGIPQNNQLPVKCYAQIQADKKKVYVENGADFTQKSGGFDSIVYYDGASTHVPIIGTLGDGLGWFSSSGQRMTVVANLGAQSSHSNDIKFRADSFSDYYQITEQTGPITRDFDGASVMNQTVRLQFESKISNAAMVKIEVLSNITDAVIIIQCEHGTTKFTFTKDTELYPVVVPSARALVTISNLKDAQKVSLKATAVQAADCDQIFTEVTGQIMLVSASTKQKSCNLVIATGTNVILDLSQVNLCNSGTLDVYQGFNKNSPKIASFNAMTFKVKIPQIWFPSGSGPRLVWKDSNNICVEPTVVGRYWTQDSDDSCGVLRPDLTGTLRTPNYPNQYPINIRCNWTLPVATNMSLMYLSVNAIDFPAGQNITLQNLTKTVATLSGRTLPADVIVPNKELSVIFNSVSKDQWGGKSGQGTQLVYKALKCGGLVTKYPANLTIPNAKNQSVECIWIIQVPATGAKKSVNVVTANITVNGYKSALNGTLEIHDGSSVRDPLVKVNLAQRNTSVIIGRGSFLFVRYAYTNSTSAPFSVNFTYTAYNCNSSSVCDNVTCILPGWRCNGILDCKDGTDEIHCNGSQPIPPVTTPMPAPGPGGKTSGVSGFWVVMCLAIGIILGVVVTIMVPKVIRRMRQKNMARASNYGSLHEDT